MVLWLMRHLTYQLNISALAALAVLGIASPVSAGVVVYTDLPSFQAAAPGLLTLNFAGYGPVSGAADYSTAAGLTVNGVNFVGRENTGDYYLAVYGTPAPGVLLGAFSTPGAPGARYDGDTTISFPTPIHAVGFNLTMGSATGAGAFTIVLSNSATASYDSAISPDTPIFVGFVSSDAFTSVVMRAGTVDGGTYYAPLISEVTYDAAPEPGTFGTAFLVAGLLALRVPKSRRVQG